MMLLVETGIGIKRIPLDSTDASALVICHARLVLRPKLVAKLGKSLCWPPIFISTGRNRWRTRWLLAGQRSCRITRWLRLSCIRVLCRKRFEPLSVNAQRAPWKRI